MSTIKYLALALGALAFRIADRGQRAEQERQAQTAEPTPQGSTFEKVCEEGVVGPFTINVDVEFSEELDEFDFNSSPLVDENEDFDYSFEIDCGDVVLFEENVDPEVEDLDQYLEDFTLAICIISQGQVVLNVTVTATKEAVVGIATEMSGDCTVEILPDFESFIELWEGTGTLCVFTNSVDLEAIPDLIIDKTCIGGPGDGDADFAVIVTTNTGDTVDFDSLDCDEVMVVADLEDGLYRIQELVTGPDALGFTTSIVCTTADGQFETDGQLAVVQIEAEPEAEVADDVECTIINVFDEDDVDPTDPGAPGGPSVIVPIDIDNTNTNTLNNNNTNDNNNVNTNTQKQSNFQEHINNNNQTTTVNSSPSVVIDFGD